MKYGLGVIGNSISYRLNKWGLAKSVIYQAKAPVEKRTFTGETYSRVDAAG
jgi:hypothetical protein